MKHRSLIKVFVLSIITLGIYFLYWLHATRREMMSLGATEIPSVWLFFAPIGGIVAAFLLYLAGYSGLDNDFLRVVLGVSTFTIGAVSVLALFVIPFFWVWRYAKGIELVTHGKTAHDYGFWLFVLVWLLDVAVIWQLMMQHEFNKLAESQTPRAPAPQRP